MKPHHHEIGRMAKTMGMVTSISLDPNQVSVRVKNSVKRMLRKGRITGGWSSQSAKLAEHIRDKFELPVTRDNWRGVQISTISMETKAKLKEIVQADWAVMNLDGARYAHVPYYRDQYNETLKTLESPDTKDFYIDILDKGLCEQARDLLVSQITEADKAKIENAIAYLDGTQPIHIVTYR